MPEDGDFRVLGYEDALRSPNYQHGYIKCRLVHMEDRSFVVPDVLLASGRHKRFFSAQFFHPNQLSFFGGDGSSDFCSIVLELIGQITVKVAFFRRGLIKRCADGSFIYKCAFHSITGEPMPRSQGDWRRRGNDFELALYHHTNEAGESGIKSSGEIWGSPWNIQGTSKLANIAHAYFTCIPKIANTVHLMEIAMSEDGVAYFLPTNAPLDAQYALRIKVYRQTTMDRTRSLKFWVNTETVAPNHLWLHMPTSEPAYYEVVLPKVFRVGVEPGRTIPFKGNVVTLNTSDCKNLFHVVVGDADTPEGLLAPYHEETTFSLAKVDVISEGSEIIARWYEKRNTWLFPSINIETARLVRS